MILFFSGSARCGRFSRVVFYFFSMLAMAGGSFGLSAHGDIVCQQSIRSLHPLFGWDPVREIDREKTAQVHDRKTQQMQMWPTHLRFTYFMTDFLYADLSKEPAFASFGEEARRLILKNVGAIQLENSCKVQCPWCGFCHNKKGKYRQFSVEALRSIFREMRGLGVTGEKTILYYQSDPFDYEAPAFEKSRTTYFYPEIQKLFEKYLGRSPYFVSTTVPAGKEETILRFIESDVQNNRNQGIRISLSDINRKRLQTKNGEGLSFLNRVQKLKKMRGQNFSRSEVPKKGTVYRITEAELYASPIVYHLNPRPIGKGFDAENKASEEVGIGCFNGSLITPERIYNVVQLPAASLAYPAGQAVVEIDSALLKIKVDFPDRALLKEVLRMGVISNFEKVLGVKRPMDPFLLLHPLSGGAVYHIKNEGGEILVERFKP